MIQSPASAHFWAQAPAHFQQAHYPKPKKRQLKFHVIKAAIFGGLTVESLIRLRLSYQATAWGQVEAKNYPVPVVWTPCHLGGCRPWFSCPCCGRRVAKLYGGAVFACRHCWRLNYASQQASKRDRAADRSWNLRRLLGCDEGFLFIPAECIRKPRGMHWRTFNRKIALLRQVEACALADIQAVLASIER